MEFVIDLYESKGKVNLVFPSVCIGKDVSVAVNGESVVQLTVGKTGEITIEKNSQVGRELMAGHSKGATITALL